MSEFLDVDFETSCNLRSLVGALLPPCRYSELAAFKSLYMSSQKNPKNSTTSPTIPKILHQIWLGGSLPAEYLEYRKSWIQLHADWEHRLWTEKEISDFDFETRDLYESTRNFGEKVDILRAEIVREFGGVYVDTDYEILKSIDPIVHRYDFFGTLRAVPLLHIVWPSAFQSPLLVCGSIFGASPGHPLLLDYLQKVREASVNPDTMDRARSIPKPPFNKKLSPQVEAKAIEMGRHLLTTYWTFHEAASQFASTHPNDTIFFPPSYFNPIDNWWKIGRIFFKTYWTSTFKSFYKSGICPYRPNIACKATYAVHHSKASWIHTG